MLPFLHRFCLAVALVACLTTAIAGQIKPNQRKTEQPTTKTEQTPAEPQDVETLKIDTNLVMVPVVASDRNGIYISDLRQDEFSISENGVKQEVAFFGTLAAPFHVVLMLDTSASTQEKLRVIQNAAFAFVEQLKPADRVKVISFDDQVRDLNEFTSNRETLRSAINSTRSGEGTRVYDAVQLALDTIRKIQGRKAIVIFTDGVDWHSLESSFQSTVRGLDEEGVIVYPIRYDTRDETERIAREQSDQMGPQLPTIDVIRRTPGGTTPQTFPSEESIPTSGTRPTTGPMGIPLPEEILRRKRESDRRNDPRNPNDPTPPLRFRVPRHLVYPTLPPLPMVAVREVVTIQLAACLTWLTLPLTNTWKHWHKSPGADSFALTILFHFLKHLQKSLLNSAPNTCWAITHSIKSETNPTERLSSRPRERMLLFALDQATSQPQHTSFGSPLVAP